MIYAACRNRLEAEKIAKHLLNKKLIACANYFPVNSMYLWKGKLTKDKEYVLLMKTDKSFALVCREIEGIHSYEIPCIEKIDAKYNKKFQEWMMKELK